MRRLLMIIVTACAAMVAIAADEPRLTREDVIRVANLAAREHADIKSYYRSEPSYDPVSKTWGVNYRLRSPVSPSTSEGLLSVSVDDTTGFTHASFSLVTPTPAPKPQPRHTTRLTFELVLLAASFALFIWSLLRKRVGRQSTLQR